MGDIRINEYLWMPEQQNSTFNREVPLRSSQIKKHQQGANSVSHKKKVS
jgi:hypothetical protein